jgi:hypothetical protein
MVALFLLLAAGGSAIAVLVVPATVSAADGMPTREPVPDSALTATFRAGRVCAFRLQLEPVVNNEYFLTFPAEPNGDVRQIITGHVVTRFTNLDTGKSIDLNTSAQNTLVFHADGFTSIETSGPQVILILAIGGRVPSATVNYGHGVYTQFPNGFLDIVSQTGAQFDVCAALSP